MDQLSPLSKADLLRAREKLVHVEGGSVKIRPLSAAYAISLRGQTLGDEQIFDLVSRSLADPELTPAEVAALPLTTLNELLPQILEYNSMSEGAADRAQDDLKKTPALTMH